MSDHSMADFLSWAIQDFIANSPENSLQNKNHEKAFDIPMVGFSAGNDPLFDAYREYVGPFHWTPREVFSMAYPGMDVKADELTVICWILPQTQKTKSDNRKQHRFPAERWARARIFGEEVNVKLRQHVVNTLRYAGYLAVAPVCLPQWERKLSDKYGFASTWSERHVAYASGLGTFGLCDGLITPVGKAIRVGSVVARIQIPPTPRPYTHHREYCLFFTHGTCKKCMSRCPVGAITEAGKDKNLCAPHVRPASEDYVKANYGFVGYGCGLCQTGVPCESGIPSAEPNQSNKMEPIK